MAVTVIVMSVDNVHILLELIFVCASVMGGERKLEMNKKHNIIH